MHTHTRTHTSKSLTLSPNDLIEPNNHFDQLYKSLKGSESTSQEIQNLPSRPLQTHTVCITQYAAYSMHLTVCIWELSEQPHNLILCLPDTEHTAQGTLHCHIRTKTTGIDLNNEVLTQDRSNVVHEVVWNKKNLGGKKLSWWMYVFRGSYIFNIRHFYNIFLANAVLYCKYHDRIICRQEIMGNNAQ